MPRCHRPARFSRYRWICVVAICLLHSNFTRRAYAEEPLTLTADVYFLENGTPFLSVSIAGSRPDVLVAALSKLNSEIAIETLVLDRVPQIGRDLSRSVGALQQLHSLQLRRTTVASDTEWQSLLSGDRLRHLVLDRVALQEDDILEIAGNDRLQIVEFYTTGVRPEDLGSLRRLPSLRQLTFIDEEITDEALDKLRGLKSLKGLALNGTKITDKSAGTIASLVGLESLDVSGSRLSDASVRAIGSLPRLRGLNITNTRMTHEGFERLRAMLPRTKILAD